MNNQCVTFKKILNFFKITIFVYLLSFCFMNNVNALQTVISPPGKKFLACSEDFLIGCSYSGTLNEKNYFATVYFGEYGSEKTLKTKKQVKSNFSGVYVAINIGAYNNYEYDKPSFSLGFEKDTYKSKNKYYKTSSEILNSNTTEMTKDSLIQDLTNNSELNLKDIENITFASESAIDGSLFKCPSSLVFGYKDNELGIRLKSSAAIGKPYSYGTSISLGKTNIEYGSNSNGAASFFGSSEEFFANQEEVNDMLKDKTCKFSDSTTKVDTGEKIDKTDTSNNSGKDPKQFTCKYKIKHYDATRCVTLTISPSEGYKSISFRQESAADDVPTSVNNSKYWVAFKDKKLPSYNSFYKEGNNILYKDNSKGYNLNSFGNYSDTFEDFYIINDSEYLCQTELNYGIVSNGSYNIIAPFGSRLGDYANFSTALDTIMTLDQNCTPKLGTDSNVGNANFDWDESCIGLFGNPKNEKSTAYILKKIFDIFKIAAPILVIALSVIGFLKAFLSQDNDAIKKESKNFVIRLVLAAALFLLPLILEFLLNIITDVEHPLECIFK